MSGYRSDDLLDNARELIEKMTDLKVPVELLHVKVVEIAAYALLDIAESLRVLSGREMQP